MATAKAVRPTDTIQVSPNGITGYEMVKKKWQGPYSAEMLLLQELSDGQPRSVGYLQQKIPAVPAPTIKQVVTRFLKTKHLTRLA